MLTNSMMKTMAAAILAAGCLAVLRAQADFNADTLAFYPFTDKAPGETGETGDFVTNAVNSATCKATLKRLGANSGQLGSITFEAFPYPFVYSDWNHTSLLTSEAQAIHIKSNVVTTYHTSSAAILFGEAARALYDWNGDFTIETFYKYDDEEGTSPMGIGVNGQRVIRIGNENYKIRIDWNTYFDYGNKYKIWDGLWHHIAIIYDSEVGKLYIACDYNNPTGETTDTDLGPDALKTVVFGSTVGAVDNSYVNYSAGDMHFACPRFTKRKLSPKEFMVAYDVPLLMASADTAFHWSFDGENGADIGTLADRSACPMDIDVMHRQYVYAGMSKSKVPSGCKTPEALKAIGSGTVYSSSSSYTNPVYCVESDRRLCRLVADDIEIAADNFTSGQLLAKAGSGQWAMSSGAGFSWKTNAISPVTGSFTIECLIRLNLPNWQAKVIDVNVALEQTRWRTVLLGRTLPYGTDEWNGTWEAGAISLHANPSSSGNTEFTMRSSYYDQTDGTVKLGAWILKDASNATYRMSNEAFGAKYHHFAISYDNDTHQARVYVDYAKMLDVTIPGTPAFNRSDSWQFGTGYNSNSFDGWYDEIRLSRKVLEPSAFIVQKPPLYGMTIFFK